MKVFTESKKHLMEKMESSLSSRMHSQLTTRLAQNLKRASQRSSEFTLVQNTDQNKQKIMSNFQTARNSQESMLLTEVPPLNSSNIKTMHFNNDYAIKINPPSERQDST